MCQASCGNGWWEESSAVVAGLLNTADARPRCAAGCLHGERKLLLLSVLCADAVGETTSGDCDARGGRAVLGGWLDLQAQLWCQQGAEQSTGGRNGEMIGDVDRLEIHDRRLEMTKRRLRLEDERTLRQLG